MMQGGEPVSRDGERRHTRWLKRAWRGIDYLARTTGRAARGNHGSPAMFVVWLIAAVFGVAVLAYGLSFRTPSWFKGALADDAESRRLAQRLENRIITEAYRFRGEPRSGPDGTRQTGEDWRLRITEQEANAWLSIKLAEWLANRDPPEKLPSNVSDVQAHFASGRAWIAARMDDSVYAISSGARADQQGVWLSGVRAGVGSLWLPVSWGGMGLVGPGARSGGDKGWWNIVRERAPLTPGGTVRLEDGRRVRIVDVRIEPGALELLCRTEVH